MVFDDDAKLLGLFGRYADPSEIEELKQSIVHYITKEGLSVITTHAPAEEKKDEVEDLSSPADAMIDVKKRRRMQAMAAEKAKQETDDNESKHDAINLAECDIGASPKTCFPLKKATPSSPIFTATQSNKFKPKQKKNK